MQIKVPQRASQTHTIFQSSVSHIWGFWVNQKSYKDTCNQTACFWLCFWGGLCTLFIQGALRNRVLLCNMLHIWWIYINVWSGYGSAFGQITSWLYYIHAKSALGMSLWYNKFFWKRATAKAQQQFCGYNYTHTQMYTLSPILVLFMSGHFIKQAFSTTLTLLTALLQQWSVPRSIILADMQHQTGLTLCSPAGTTVHFHKLH